MTVFVLIWRLIVGGTFLFSALPKLRNPKGFILTVLEYRILPPYLSRLYAAFIPPLEFTVALFSLTGIMLRLAAIIMSFLLLSFVVAISVNIKRGRNLDCNCFGTLKKHPIGKKLLIQDSILLASTIFISVTHTWTLIELWSIFRMVGITNDGFGLTFVAGGTILSVMFFLRWFLPQKNSLFREKNWLSVFDHDNASLKGKL